MPEFEHTYRDTLDAYLDGDLPKARAMVEALLATDLDRALRKKLEVLERRIEDRLAGRK